MGLKICSLNSGSNANCYYVGNDTDAILVDAGLGVRETERRFKKAGLSLETLKAIFISHEHSDHITGLATLSKKYKLPVYISPATFFQTRLTIAPELLRYFTGPGNIIIGSLVVTPFVKSHDAVDPYSFLISGNDVRVGVFTDMGHACDELVEHFRLCHAAFLESNYCDTMLANGPYPAHLKKRIGSNKGHLSNAQALELFLQHRTPQLQHLVLAHLSKNNNRPATVEELFKPHAGTVQISVASRNEAGPVIEVSGSPGEALPSLQRKGQLSLF
jgi:phosphoribosyl 1,2-cyclic phosphodiesterase